MTSSGNPIKLDMKTKYKAKGVGTEHTIESVVNIYYDKSAGKIEKVEDKWNNELPEGAFKNVSQLLNPFWWLRYAENWCFWLCSFVWYTWPWQVRRCVEFPGSETSLSSGGL